MSIIKHIVPVSTKSQILICARGRVGAASTQHILLVRVPTEGGRGGFYLNTLNTPPACLAQGPTALSRADLGLGRCILGEKSKLVTALSPANLPSLAMSFLPHWGISIPLLVPSQLPESHSCLFPDSSLICPEPDLALLVENQPFTHLWSLWVLLLLWCTK